MIVAPQAVHSVAISPGQIRHLLKRSCTRIQIPVWLNATSSIPLSPYIPNIAPGPGFSLRTVGLAAKNINGLQVSSKGVNDTGNLRTVKPKRCFCNTDKAGFEARGDQSAAYHKIHPPGLGEN